MTATNETGADAGTDLIASTMIHQFMYPKVTPVRPSSGGGSKPGGAAVGGSGRGR
jgi:hypothetical protein